MSYQLTEEELELAMLGAYHAKGGAVVSFADDWKMNLDGSDEIFHSDGVIATIQNDTAGAAGLILNTSDITHGGIQTFWSLGRAGQVSRILLYTLTDGKLYAQCVNGGSTKWLMSTDSAAIVNNTTVFIGIDQDGTSPTLYVNGVAPAQTISTTTDITAWAGVVASLDNQRIGGARNSGGADKWFTLGTINEFVYYRKSLSAAEWLEWYNSGVVLDMDTHSAGSPYQWLRMGDNGVFGTDWTLTDQGTGGNDATSVNMEEPDRITA